MPTNAELTNIALQELRHARPRPNRAVAAVRRAARVANSRLAAWTRRALVSLPSPGRIGDARRAFDDALTPLWSALERGADALAKPTALRELHALRLRCGRLARWTHARELTQQGRMLVLGVAEVWVESRCGRERRAAVLGVVRNVHEAVAAEGEVWETGAVAETEEVDEALRWLVAQGDSADGFVRRAAEWAAGQREWVEAWRDSFGPEGGDESD